MEINLNKDFQNSSYADRILLYDLLIDVGQPVDDIESLMATCLKYNNFRKCWLSLSDLPLFEYATSLLQYMPDSGTFDYQYRYLGGPRQRVPITSLNLGLLCGFKFRNEQHKPSCIWLSLRGDKMMYRIHGLAEVWHRASGLTIKQTYSESNNPYYSGDFKAKVEEVFREWEKGGVQFPEYFWERFKDAEFI